MSGCAIYFDIAEAVTVLCFGSGTYGIHLATAAMTCYFAAKQAQNPSHLRWYYIYVGCLIVFSSVNYFICMALYFYGKEHPILYRFYSEPLRRVLFTIPELMAMLVSILCNSFLIYRCYIVWSGWKMWKAILLLPISLFFAALVTGLISIVGSGIMDMFLLRTYWPMVLGLNFTLTTLICIRILWLRRKLRVLLGPQHTNHMGRGWGIVALVVESSFIYTLVTSLGFIRTSPGSFPYVFSPVLVQTECIASELIILQIVLGRAMTKQWNSTVQTRTLINHECSQDVVPPYSTVAVL